VVGRVIVLNLDRLEDLLTLPHAWFETTVRKDEPIDAELAIVHMLAKVASVRPEPGFLLLGPQGPVHFTPQALIDPIPDEPALETVRGAKEVPVVLQVTYGG
jgi:hypothetical protein